MQTIHFGRVICLAFSDGSIEYRDRFTLQETYNETNLDRVMTLHQAGFTFAEESPCSSIGPFFPVAVVGKLTLFFQACRQHCHRQTVLSPRSSKTAASSGTGCITPWMTLVIRTRTVGSKNAIEAQLERESVLTGPLLATYAAVIAALAVAASAATFYHVNCDDILAVARPYAEKKSKCPPGRSVDNR